MNLSMRIKNIKCVKDFLTNANAANLLDVAYPSLSIFPPAFPSVFVSPYYHKPPDFTSREQTHSVAHF